MIFQKSEPAGIVTGSLEPLFFFVTFTTSSPKGIMVNPVLVNLVTEVGWKARRLKNW